MSSTILYEPGRSDYTGIIRDALERDGRIHFGPGDFYWKPFNFNRPHHITGEPGTRLMHTNGHRFKHWKLLSGCQGSIWQGMRIHGGGWYSGMEVDADDCRLQDIFVEEYAFKGVNVHVDSIQGSFIGENIIGESSLGDASGADEYRPTAFQADIGEAPTSRARLLHLKNLRLGDHPDSSVGMSCKFAQWDSIILEGVICTGSLDSANSASIIFAEGHKSVRMIGCVVDTVTQFPYLGAGVSGYIENLSVENCIFGALGQSHRVFLWDHLLAHHASFRNNQFNYINNRAITEETPVTENYSREFVGNTFHTQYVTSPHSGVQPMVIYPDAGLIPVSTDPDVRHFRQSQNYLDGGSGVQISSNTDMRNLWNNAEY